MSELQSNSQDSRSYENPGSVVRGTVDTAALHHALHQASLMQAEEVTVRAAFPSGDRKPHQSNRNRTCDAGSRRELGFAAQPHERSLGLGVGTLLRLSQRRVISLSRGTAYKLSPFLA